MNIPLFTTPVRHTKGGERRISEPSTLFWLVVSTPLKNISQNGNLPQVGMKIKNIWNPHLVLFILTRGYIIYIVKSLLPHHLIPPNFPTPFQKKKDTTHLFWCPKFPHLSKKNTPMLIPKKNTPSFPPQKNKQTNKQTNKIPSNTELSALDDRNPGRCQSAVEASCTSSLGPRAVFCRRFGAFWRFGRWFPRETPYFWLVVEPTHLKNIIVKLDPFPKCGWK